MTPVNTTAATASGSAGLSKAAELNTGQEAAVGHLLRVLAAGALGGGAARLGMGVLRNMNPRYEPPPAPSPVVVDIPSPIADEPPLAKKPAPMRKAAAPGFWPFGQETWDKWVPNWTPPAGRPDAQTPTDVPLAGAALPFAVAGGAGAGYLLADKLLRYADRRRSVADLDKAKEEYRAAVLERTQNSHAKEAGDATADQPDSTLDRILAATGRAYDLTKEADDQPNYLLRVLAGLGYPGLAVSPEAGYANMAVVGGLAGLGGVTGYLSGRDDAATETVRKQVAAVDRENARRIPPPLVARLVPTKKPAALPPA